MKDRRDIINQIAVSYGDVSLDLWIQFEKAFNQGIEYGNKNIIEKKRYFFDSFYYEIIGELDKKDKIYQDTIDIIKEKSQEEIKRKENDWKNKSLFKRVFKI